MVFRRVRNDFLRYIHMRDYLGYVKISNNETKNQPPHTHISGFDCCLFSGGSFVVEPFFIVAPFVLWMFCVFVLLFSTYLDL